MSTKIKLKQTKEYITAKNYDRAEETASDILSFEPSNYNARVLLGVSRYNLGKVKEAQEAYEKAIETDPKQALAWQGLLKLYEEQKDWKNLIQALYSCINLSKEKQDATKIAEHLSKLIEVQKSHGTTEQLIDVYNKLLPSSNLYTLLSTLPPPDPTATTSTIKNVQTFVYKPVTLMTTMLEILETSEHEKIESEVKQRRTRLNSITKTAEETRRVVQRQFMSKSKIQKLYQDILDHPDTTDELRRTAETNLLQYRYTLLKSLPSKDEQPDPSEQQLKLPSKLKTSNTVESLAKGITLLKLSNELAWNVSLDWDDASSPDHYDQLNLENYLACLPMTPLSQIIRGHLYFLQQQNDNRKESEEESSKDDEEEINEQVAYEMIEDGYDKCHGSSLTAHILAIKYFDQIGDGHQSVIRVCESAQRFINKLCKETGRQFEKSSIFFSKYLSHALTHLNAPRYHKRAKKLLQDLESKGSFNYTCLFDMGIILENERQWEQAISYFDRVLLESAVPEQVNMDAIAERAWCKVNLDEYEQSSKDLAMVIEFFEKLIINEEKEKEQVQKSQQQHQQSQIETQVQISKTLALLYWRLGQCKWLRGGEYRELTEHAYAAFIHSIKHTPTFAPSFTSLGLYYLEVCSPPDHQRASKCFQKAFELDPREEVAARLLADEFSSTGDWDLVETVARRVVEGELNDATTSLSERTTRHGHTWAYKAVGSAELNGKRYNGAIPAFQSALRAEPNDVQTWMKLGLAYSGSGRHVAAFKTFSRALEIDPSVWQIRVCMGDVQRELGLYEYAINIYNQVLTERPHEVGVELVLAETHLLMAKQLSKTGVKSRVHLHLQQALMRSTLHIASEEGSPNERLAWKIAAETLTELSSFGMTMTVASTMNDQYLESFQTVLEVLKTIDVDYKVSGLDSVSLDMTTQMMENVLQFKEQWQEDDQEISSDEEYSYVKLLCSLFALTAISANKMRVSIEASSESIENLSTAWFELGISFDCVKKMSTTISAIFLQDEQEGQENLITLDDEQVSNDCIYCIRQSLRLDPVDSIYWNALGIFMFQKNPQLSQHSFIRAAEISPRSAAPWVNLGLFYMEYNDYELSNKAFLRAQIIDPDLSDAWLGQASLALINSDYDAANVLINHTFDIAHGCLPFADLLYGMESFAQPPDMSRSSQAWGFPSLKAQFAIERFLSNIPNDASGLHLHGLLCERLEKLETAIDSIHRASVILEDEYEREETKETETKYIIVNLSLGRVHLSYGNYEESISAIDNVLALTEDIVDPDLEEEEEEEDNNGSDKEDKRQRFIVRVQALSLSGLANYFIQDLNKALEYLRLAHDTLLNAAYDVPKDIFNHVTLVLATVLYSDPDTQQEAKDLLLSSITDPVTGTPILSSIVALASMAIEEGDEQLLEASISEIIKLPTDQKQELDPAGDVDNLLINYAMLQDDEKQSRQILSRKVYMQPWSLNARMNLARHLIKYNNYNKDQEDKVENIGDLLCGVGSNNSSVFDSAKEEAEVLRIRAVASKMQNDEAQAIMLASRAIKLDPSNDHSWLVLSFCQNSQSKE